MTAPCCRTRSSWSTRRRPWSGRLHGPAVCERRPDSGPPPRGGRLRGGHAARLADRLRDGDPEPLQHPDHRRGGRGSGDPRRGDRHRVGCGACHGARMRRRPFCRAPSPRPRTRSGWRSRCGERSRRGTRPAGRVGSRASFTRRHRPPTRVPPSWAEGSSGCLRRAIWRSVHSPTVPTAHATRCAARPAGEESSGSIAASGSEPSSIAALRTAPTWRRRRRSQERQNSASIASPRASLTAAR